MVDPKAAMVEVTVSDRDLSIYQSPSILSSGRAAGTTGAGTVSPRSLYTTEC